MECSSGSSPSGSSGEPEARRGGERRDNDIVRETFRAHGASVMGKAHVRRREQAWPEEAPFHTPVFVVTHGSVTPGSGRRTTFPLRQLTASSPRSTWPRAAGDRDVASRGGGATILEHGERRPDRRVHDRALGPCCSARIRLFRERAARRAGAGRSRRAGAHDLRSPRERVVSRRQSARREQQRGRRSERRRASVRAGARPRAPPGGITALSWNFLAAPRSDGGAGAPRLRSTRASILAVR